MKTDFPSTTGCNADLTEDEIENVKRGSWMIDCAYLELKQRGHEGLTYSGPGLLWQDKKKQLVYKIYATGSFEFPTVWHSQIEPAGTILSEDAYYDLVV